MGYMVLTLPDGDGHLGSGLTLSEAFHRVMAFAHCEYIFHRIDGVMHLSLHHVDGVPDEWRDDPELRAHYFPAYQSNLVDDAMARTAIMRNLLHTGFKGYYVVRDNYPDGNSLGPLSTRDLKLLEHASFRI